MNRESMMESLRNKACYVVDIFPSNVSKQAENKALELETYFRSEAERKRIIGKFERIILKLQCYHSFEIYCGRWYPNISISELAILVEKVMASNDGVMNILSREENMFLCIKGSELKIFIYNPTIYAIGNLSSLAVSEGLFLRRI